MGRLRDAAGATGLPAVAILDEVVAGGRSVVVAAPPGAGKTTLVPLALADALPGRVLLLEPRRIAARAAATRMASLLGERVGATVGLRMRGESKAGSAIEVVTEGVLTRMVQDDPSLDGVSAVVFDEFHERSLHADLGLALVLDARRGLRPDLVVGVMSATLDVERVAALLDHPTVVRCDVPAFAVEVVWAPPLGGTGAWTGREADVAALIRRGLAEVPDGDVLVFLPGAREQRRVARLLGSVPGVAVHLLHGRASAAEQSAALAPAAAGHRKVVLATAVAETSITLPGVRVVVDAGLARSGAHDHRRGLGGLATERVTRATATQRTGRAGRVAAGRAYRLWSEADHARLAEHPPAEILVADLVPLALEVAVWGASIGSLDLLDQPPAEAWAAALEELFEMGAIDAADGEAHATAHGRRLRSIALHPRLAHLAVAAAIAGHGAPGALLAVAVDEGMTPDGSVDAQRLLDQSPSVLRTRARRVADQARVEAHGPRPSLAVALALAWPSRLARRRPGGPGRFDLAAGGGVTIDASDPLRGADLLLVLEADLPKAGAPDAIVRLALPVDEAELLRTATDVRPRSVAGWDARAGEVVARQDRCIGDFVVSSEAAALTPTVIVDAARVALATEGVGLLGWSSAALALRARLAVAHAWAADEGWPSVDDGALLERLDDWAPALLADRLPRRRADFGTIDAVRVLTAVARACVGGGAMRRLDALAPSTLALPGGRHATVDYADGQPSIRVRLQDLFGCRETPRLGDRGAPVVVHVLSPAGRPVQVTSDLAGFWAGSYAEVRKEMRGRYPKHPWPDDPGSAPPRRTGPVQKLA